MNQSQDHLTVEQIESLMAIEPDKQLSPDRAILRDRAELHLAQCAACREALAMETEAQRKIRSLGGGERSTGAGECPSQSRLYELAGKLLPDEDAERVMSHVSECDRCAPVLRQAIDDLGTEPTAEETALIGSLATAKPKWQASLAQQLAGSSKARREEKSSSVWRYPRLGWSLGAAIGFAVIALFLVSRPRSSPEHAATLLARAYTEQRTMELRVAGASYARVQVRRGGGSSRFERPAPLLEAEELIARKLRERPDDPDWLESKARADLMDGNYQSALDTLQQLSRRKPNSASVLTDLATAYYQRGDTMNRPIDFGSAIEALGKALANAPDDPVALFNRALVCERISLYKQAGEDWEHYLRIDPRGGWAGEAREHLKQIRGKQKQRNNVRSEPLLSPREFAERIRKAPDGDAKIDDRLEEYLAAAVEDWLRGPDSQSSQGSAAETAVALRELARLLRVKHRDSWLEDLLTSSALPTFKLATLNLAEATATNEKADTSSAQEHAARALVLFRSMRGGNEAGNLRAKLELMSASKFAQNGQACLKDAYSSEAEARRRSYTWLVVQFLLEQGSCEWLVGNLGGALENYRSAANTAESIGYRNLYLRSRDHLGGIEAELGNYESAWSLTSSTLQDFWLGDYPDVRGYNLYYDYYELSRLRQQPYLQLAAWREGVELSESSGDIAQRAMAHALLAGSAWAVRNSRLAAQEFERAEALFSGSPRTKPTELAQLETEARQAMLETSQGEVQRAITRLKPLEPSVRDLSDPYLAVLFYTTLGDAELQNGETKEAESALKSAVELAELQLASLREEDSKLDWTAKSERAYRDLVELRLAQGDDEGALKLWEAYRGAPLRGGWAVSMKTSASAEPALVTRDKQLATSGGQQIVTYALLPRSLAIWFRDGQQIKVSWSKRTPGQIEEKVAAFRRLCEDPASDRALLGQLARELYHSLVAPVGTFLLRDQDLVIEPDDQLGGLAFDALIDDRGGYFGDQRSLTLSLGPYYRKGHRLSAIGPDSRALVVVVRSSSADAGEALPSLPDAQREGYLIAGKFREAHILNDQEVNAGAVLERLAGSEIFHFAGHALSSPGRSGLLLSGSLLRASAFNESRVAKLQLAVLSTCDSEDGSNGSVLDGDSIARKLMGEGVPYVVASRWKVDSAATREFMNLFYDRVMAGDSVAQAMNRAQALLRSRPETAHPFYWSAFATFSST